MAEVKALLFDVFGTCVDWRASVARQVVAMAKRAGLPWDCILGAEVVACYKPEPESYLGAVRLLGLEASEAMMVAAHADDLRAARAAGLRAAFVARPHERGPGTGAESPPEGCDVVAADFRELAERPGA